MTELDLPALKKLCEAATPGPWHIVIDEESEPTLWILQGGKEIELTIFDLNLIEAARTAVPQLIERIENQSKLLVAQGQEISCFGKENTTLKAEVERLKIEKLEKENQALRHALRKILDTAEDNLIAAVADDALEPKYIGLSGDAALGEK